MCFVPNVFRFLSTSQSGVLKQATNANEPRIAVLQWGKQAASLQSHRSGFWGMERTPKDNTIKFRGWFLPFCQHLKPFSPFSQQCYKESAAGLWLLAASPREAGCWMHPGLAGHPVWCPPTPGQSWPLWPHNPAYAHSLSFSFYAKLCDALSVVSSMLFPKPSSQCIFSASGSWLQPFPLWSCCSPPNSSIWGLPHTPHPGMHPCSCSTELKPIARKLEIFSKLFFKTHYLRGQLRWDLQASMLWA